MTKLDRLLNTLFSRMKGQEGAVNTGFVFYWLDNGKKVVIVRQSRSQSLYKPKQALPPKTASFIEGTISDDGVDLVLTYKYDKSDGTLEIGECLVYGATDIRLAASHAVNYLVRGVIPEPVESVEQC